MRSRNYFIPEVKVAGKVSLFPVLSKIIFRKTNWQLGADLGSWQSLTKGSREEILRVCLPEHSVLSFWHCMFSPGLEVATGWEVNLPEEGKKAMTNKADCQLPVSTWQRRWCTTWWTLSPYLWSTQPCYSAVPVLQAAEASLQAAGAKLTVP